MIAPIIGMWIIWLSMSIYENREAKSSFRVFTVTFGIPVFGITLLIAITELKGLII